MDDSQSLRRFSGRVGSSFKSVVLYLSMFSYVAIETAAWMKSSYPPSGLLLPRRTSFLQHGKISSSIVSRSTQVDPKQTFSLTAMRGLPLDDTVMDMSPFVIAAAAVALGVAAQTLINQMLKGDQGLAAFLSDGSGFQKSGFRSVKSDNAQDRDRDDPLPWLKLPKLDFVDVAGQVESDEQVVYERLEQLREKMNSELQAGRIEEATRLKQELESIMDINGIEFKAGDAENAR